MTPPIPTVSMIAAATAASAATFPRRSEPLRIGAAWRIAASRVVRSRSSDSTA